MTHDLTPHMLDMLRQIQGGADPSQFNAAQINRLVKAGFLQDVPTGLALTQDGLDAVANATWYVVQQQSHKAWVNIPAERPFADLQAAERRASQYSVQAESLIRIINEDVLRDQTEPAYFTAFDFGKRYTIDTQSGARIADPGFRETTDDFVDSGHFFVVQRRTPRQSVDQPFGIWELASERQFVDLDLAMNNAMADVSEPYEYRVALADGVELPPIVYFHGAPMPDLGLLDQLAQIGAGQLPGSDPLPVQKQSALGIMLAEWALHNAKDILSICAVALDDEPDLSDQVRELRDTL